MGRAFVLGFVLALAVLLVTPGLSHGAEGSKFQPAVKTRLGVVATESPAASRVGRSVLERGGNAADAAVATVFAIGVARARSFADVVLIGATTREHLRRGAGAPARSIERAELDALAVDPEVYWRERAERPWR